MTWLTPPDLLPVLLAAVAGGFAVTLAMILSLQRRQMARMDAIMQTVDLGVFMSRELNGKILFWSKGAEQLYGYSRAEAVGAISHDLLQTQFPVPLAEIERAVLLQGEWRGDLHHWTKDGRHLIVAARKVRRTGLNGKVVILLEALADVTEERFMQAKLADLRRTLEARVEREVAVRAKAAERIKDAAHFQALGRIAAGVAHEFNNILQVITGSLNMIENHTEDIVRVLRFTDLARGAAERGALITSRLLGFARRSPLMLEKVDLTATLTAFGDVLPATLNDSIAVKFELAEALPTLMLDRGELQVALLNLATNARDAMSLGGWLRITTAVETYANGDHPASLAAGRYVRITVADTGCGMDEATLRQAVDPFFTTKEMGRGTGLGLSMVKGFTEQSGGGMTLQSMPGQGTTVTLWLPVHPELAHAGATA